MIAEPQIPAFMKRTNVVIDLPARVRQQLAPFVGPVNADAKLPEPGQ